LCIREFDLGFDMSFPMPEGDPCFFCEIANGNTHQWQIEEDELTMTLLNGRQFEIGQCVVIPRRHAPTLLDLDESEEAAVMAAARRLARALVGTDEKKQAVAAIRRHL
jgi:diadenosine tetraphosphate (Ap4A) HIT family hydrolase